MVSECSGKAESQFTSHCEDLSIGANAFDAGALEGENMTIRADGSDAGSKRLACCRGFDRCLEGCTGEQVAAGRVDDLCEGG